MISGVGIHSGSLSHVTLHRAAGPLRFRVGRKEIPANLCSVESTERCVTLGSEGVRVATVEHLLAALQIAGFWSGVVIEVEGEELPILDGSARPWLEEIARLGQPPEETPQPIVPTGPLELTAGDSKASLLPGEPAIDVSVAYPHPSVGEQRWCGAAARWQELLDARTFGFMTEANLLKAASLARGASAENAIVFVEDGPLSPLRHPDEPVRHKALDLVGDLTLLGRPLHARVRVERGSHRLHVNLMRHLISSPRTMTRTA